MRPRSEFSVRRLTFVGGTSAGFSGRPGRSGGRKSPGSRREIVRDVQRGVAVIAETVGFGNGQPIAGKDERPGDRPVVREREPPYVLCTPSGHVAVGRAGRRSRRNAQDAIFQGDVEAVRVRPWHVEHHLHAGRGLDDVGRWYEDRLCARGFRGDGPVGFVVGHGGISSGAADGDLVRLVASCLDIKDAGFLEFLPVLNIDGHENPLVRMRAGPALFDRASGP